MEAGLEEDDTMNLEELSDDLGRLEEEKEVKEEKPIQKGEGSKNDLKFNLFCTLLENISTKKPKAKLKLLEGFFKTYMRNKDPYSVIRLLLPQLDRERGNYGLKELSLARMYSDIMLLPPDESNRLKHYKNPTFQKGAPAGDFVTVLMSVMQKRCRTDSVLTLQAVNSYLDQLAKSIDNQQKKNILSELFHESTLEEQKWLARIILKDLKIGLGHETVLKNYHPDAVDLYNITSDLKEVFRDLSGNDKRMGADRFRIFFPIRPMLADKMPLKQLAVILEKNKVLIETKFDGERIQCHFKDDVVKFFSRNSNNYTHIYGPKMAPIIRENVNAKSVILDGEMVVWDTITNSMAPFGQNKPVALEEGDPQGKQLCYMVFDILYVHGFHGEEANLMGGILSDRKMVLSRVIRPVPHVLEVIKGTPVQEIDKVYAAFNKSVHNNEEGIMVKQVESIYKPNERSNLWIKLKGEYIDSLGDSLDLLIIGGYFGEGKRTGGSDWQDHITVFLLGIRKTTNKADPRQSTIHPFCKVGTGYSIPELYELRAKLKSEWRRYDTRMPPSYFWDWTPGMSERPDAFIQDPSHSVVLEVRAAEIVVSDQYPTNYTLRFPRVNRIRYDKNWDDSMTIEELKSILENFAAGRRLKRKHKNIEDVLQEEEGKKKKRKNVRKQKKDGDKEGLCLTQFRATDLTALVSKDTFFQRMEFYVVSLGDSQVTKQFLERTVAEYGGLCVQNLLPTTTHLIAARKDFKVQNIIKASGKCVIHYNWILKCAENGELIELTPDYMIYSNQQMTEYFQRNLDIFNDHYTIPVTVNGLKELMNNIPSQYFLQQESYPLMKLKEKYETKLNLVKDMVFNDHIFYLNHNEKFSDNDNKTNELLITIRQYGGKITKEFDPTKITHILSHNFISNQEKRKVINEANKYKLPLVFPKSIFEMVED